MRDFVGAVFGLALTIFCASGAWGQAQFTTGSVQGDVVDEKGGSVPGANVEAKNLGTNYITAQTTNADGHFAFLSLAPGDYTFTISKEGFATILQQNVNLTVGQAVSLPLVLKVSTVSEQIVVTDTPVVEVNRTESSSTLGELAVADTPVLGRKFEDLLTLTPGVAITQGPDGDEINFNGQRGIFNNVSLDGGDYNNGFFGEQVGGQRAAIDITLDAVKEFQVVASGANAEFGRTAGGVVNVITKSGTNNVHGSAFEYYRTEALTAATSDGKPLDNFLRNQFGGSIGGPIRKDKLFFFGAGEGIRENLTRKNLSAPLGASCPVSSPVFNNGSITDAQIAANTDCQRAVLLNFMKTNFNENDGLPVDHLVRNGAAFGRVDYNLNTKNQIFGSYNYDYSKNTNQTFDVPSYGTTANGIEGPSKIQAINTNWFSTISGTKLNEAHFTYARENRPRNATDPNSVPDTSIGSTSSANVFRFGQPFFLEPSVDELFWRTDVRDNFTVSRGKHTIKLGGEWIHSNNTQIFRGFFNGVYFFDSVTGFLHYASSGGTGFGPTTLECSTNGKTTGTLSYSSLSAGCAAGSRSTGGPLLLFLQKGPTRPGETKDQSGASSINNEEFALFLQDSWKLTRNVTVNYGLRWEAQHFPDPVIAPSQTAYGQNLSDPRFPSTGRLPNQNKEFQPRIGFAWDIKGNGKSALRASWGIFNARQNMLTQVGAITTNGVQQQTLAAGTFFNTANPGAKPPGPTYAPPFTVPVTPLPAGQFPFQAGVTVFSKDYSNPRIYTTNVGYEQEIASGWAGYVDLTISKGVRLTRFTNPNVCCSSANLIQTADVNLGAGPSYTGPAPFSNLGGMTVVASSAKSLYRGATVGVRKRFSHRFQLDANYVWSEDLDDDSNERDPFSFRYYDLFNLAKEYSYSDRDEKHKFNFITYTDLPAGFNLDVRMQAHTAQPTSGNPNATGAGPLCSETQALHRVQLGLGPGGSNVDCGRNFLRKDNGYFAFNFALARPVHLGERFRVVPKLEVFNLFNDKNNVNTLTTGTPLEDFDGFIRQGVGDPREAQLSIRLEF
jgi:carboxypeptidase family protein